MRTLNSNCLRSQTRKKPFFRALRFVCLGIFLVAVLPSVSVADEPPPPGVPAALADATAVTDHVFPGMTAVALDDLEVARGGESTVVHLEDMVAGVDGNTIEGTVTTGSAAVGGDAFQGFNGLNSVIINSGNHVSIQSSTTVNIVIDGK